MGNIITIIKDFKIVASIVITIIGGTAVSINWTYSNVVFASEFDSYKMQQELNWLDSKGYRLRTEYYGLRNLKVQTSRDKRRLDEVESELDRISTKRSSLEKELRSMHIKK